jgi:hypothetical protein
MPPAIRRLARSSSTPAATRRPRSCSPTNGTHFKSKPGQLAGNHFLTITEGHENLRPLGELCLWEGAQDIVFDRA